MLLMAYWSDVKNWICWWVVGAPSEGGDGSKYPGGLIYQQ